MTRPKITAIEAETTLVQAGGSVPASGALPYVGMSKWNQLSPFVAVSREKWRQLVLAGKAPAPHRLSERCTMYPNIEVHRWLADPVNYRQAAGGAA